MINEVTHRVCQAEREVTHHPEERRKILLDFFWVALAEGFCFSDLQLTRKVNDQAERVERVLVDCVHRIEDEVRREE